MDLSPRARQSFTMKTQEEKKGGIYMNRFCSAINLSSFITACFAREEIKTTNFMLNIIFPKLA